MTWTEIKNAVEKAGIKENDEVTVIQCEPRNGAKTFHVIKLGKVVKLAEDFAESAIHEASGCTC